MRRSSHANPLAVFLLHVVVISGALITVLPLLWMAYSSFKTTAEIFRYPPWLPPETWSFHNYASLLEGYTYDSWYGNSLLFAGAQTLLTLFFCSLAGVALAKYTFKGKNILFGLLISSTLIPFQLMLIPLFIEMSQIGWVNTPYAMVLPWVAPAFGIYAVCRALTGAAVGGVGAVSYLLCMEWALPADVAKLSSLLMMLWALCASCLQHTACLAAPPFL